ncbi:LysR family transcriptional regulator [Actinokineospora xionganensis]|uniref:LysR family transcriptional regulator n=1 Tax=Actinokineospora xionganensis TaxID=2684470 RepID=A0ABR7L304_9PSEU|nr:LysR family transcriptional regulator [Actinokineospora xionganensis]MBC6446883.1 LysR family transcriptional regulator [Actinokineospora xionganensis]
MELRHLISFLAIADERHFGRAAARLHLAQPSLSAHLQRLERAVGTRLVDRTSHDVTLTPAGVVFRDQVRDIVARLDRAALAARAVAAGREGTVRAGYNFPAGRYVLPATLATLAERHPGIDVDMREMRTGPQLAALDEKRIDVAMVYGRPASPNLRHRLLLRVPLVAVVGLAHRLAGRERVPFGELAGEPCILFRRDQSSAMYDAILAAAERSGIRLTVADRVDDPGATAILASVRPVVGFASALRARHTDGRTTAVALYDPVPTLDLHAVWRDEPAELADAFVDCLPDPAEIHRRSLESGSDERVHDVPL